MTKEIFFDLNFAEDGITALSSKGQRFLRVCDLARTTMWASRQTLYLLAVDSSLHIRFETAAVRDSVTAA